MKCIGTDLSRTMKEYYLSHMICLALQEPHIVNYILSTHFNINNYNFDYNIIAELLIPDTGRVDIGIVFNNNTAIYIETKLYTKDASDQLTKYINNTIHDYCVGIQLVPFESQVRALLDINSDLTVISAECIAEMVTTDHKTYLKQVLSMFDDLNIKQEQKEDNSSIKHRSKRDIKYDSLRIKGLAWLHAIGYKIEVTDEIILEYNKLLKLLSPTEPRIKFYHLSYLCGSRFSAETARRLALEIV
ncbi:hypothetical protein [Ralstonia phage RP13]|nr:hypothetical protein [Ralstonia phage RP13]